MAGNPPFRSALSDVGGDSDSSSEEDLRYPKLLPKRHIAKRCPPPPAESKPSHNIVACQILVNWGWKKGRGLGKDGNGITKPLLPHLRPKFSGLGASSSGDNSTTLSRGADELPRKRKGTSSY